MTTKNTAAKIAPVNNTRSKPKAHLAAVAKYPGCSFEVIGDTERKPNTDGFKAYQLVKQYPGITTEQLKDCGNVMQHIDWDVRVNKTIKVTRPSKTPTVKTEATTKATTKAK